MPTTKLSHSTRAAVVLLLAILSAPACSLSMQRASAVALEQVSIKSLELRDKVEAQHQRGQMPDIDYKAWKSRLGKVGRIGQALTSALAKADGQEAARQLDAFFEALTELVNEQVVKMTPSEQLTFTIVIESIRSALTIISAVSAT